LFDLEYEGGDIQDDKCYINNEINYMISTFVYYELSGLLKAIN